MAIRDRGHWNSEEQQRKRQQKRIYRDLIRQGKPATAQAIEAELRADKQRNADRNNLLAGTNPQPCITKDSFQSAMASVKAALYLPPNIMYYGTSPWVTYWRNEPPKPLPEETIVSAIPAWRMWRVPLFGKTLRSVVKYHTWPIRKRFESECLSLQCEGVNCSCGIYAWKQRERAGEYSRENKLTEIIGEVWLWGRVLECELGYRAQYAYPKSFINTGAQAQQYAAIYGVPVID